MRSESRIKEQVSTVLGILDDPDAFRCFGMSYEDGVLAALDWVLETTNDKPVEDQ